MKQKYLFNQMTYFILLSLGTFLFWAHGLDLIGILVFSTLSFFVLTFKKNSIYAVPIILNMMFIVSRTDWDLSILPLFYYIAPVLLVLGFVIHYIRFKEKWVHGHLFFPLVLLFIGILVAIVNSQKVDTMYLFYIAFGLFYVLAYTFFVQTIKGNQTDYILKLFYVLGILISAQVLYYYLVQGDIVEALNGERIHLGWGLSNYVATYLIIFISTMFYYIKYKPLRIVTAIFLAFEILMLLFTLSRGGVLAFVILTPFIIIYIYHGTASKLRTTLYLVIVMLLLVLVFIFQKDFFLPLYERFKVLDLMDGNGRVDIWLDAIDKFKQHPLLGNGILSRWEDGFHFYHNTILHTLASFGLIGFASLIWQGVEVLLAFLRKINTQKAIMFIALLGANIHGMVDNVYYQLHYMLIFFVIFVVVETANREEDALPKLWKPE